jgi:RHS repeat-associated protein
MKKILIPIGTLLVSGLSHAQLSNTENYVYSKTYLDYNGTTATKFSETVQYFDGLGRPKQVVNIKASPQGKDVVTPIIYDSFGRQVRDYLPVPQQSTQNGGVYTQSSAMVDFPVGDPAGVYANEKAFVHKNLENSPLNRILSQVQPGSAWQGKPVQFTYDANIDGEVKKYSATFNYTTFEARITSSGSYGAGHLYKNTVIDEDNNKTIEFKNDQGQVILVKKMLTTTESADTYYVYNDYNQLAFVISPNASEAVKNLAVGAELPSDALNNLCYQYKYDRRNRLVEKKLPGKGWEYMVYDKQDRLVLTRDANLEAQGKWLFTKYDQFSRPIYTGLVYSPPGRAQQVAAVEGLGSNNEVRTTSSFNNTGMDVYYTTNSAYPQYNYTLLSVNYYDSYPGYGFNPSFPTSILGEPTLTETPTAEGLSTKSLPVMSLVKNIEDDNWTKNYTYYDKKGRAIGSYSINHLGGRTKVESKLDFAGVVKQSITRHKRLDTDTDKVITENFTYDQQNRLMTHTHQVDSNPVEYLAQNTYNELSQLSGKKVGGISPSVPLQDISYSYNIRGWMTKINDPVNLNGKLFGYEIKYNNPESVNIAPGRFNGNIAEIDWNNGSENLLKRYNYTYDKLNRLTNAFYKEPSTGVTGNFDEYLTYDLNGNISNLKRTAIPVSGLTGTLVDNLDYQYTGNRLDQIIENSTNETGYEGGNNLINYDVNGNMINMKDKGIQTISYNYLNLPYTYSISENNFGAVSNITLGHLYRADGVKLRKTYINVGPRGYSTTTNMTDYLDGFQYSSSETTLCTWCRTSVAYEEQAYQQKDVLLPPVGGVKPPLTPSSTWILSFVPTAEGFYSFEENRYIYQYTDHLGNARISYAKNTDGVLEITDRNDYYAFGLNHIGGPKGLLGGYQNYKYNGKELHETGMYDYGARFYMPDIGRWGVVDPRSQYTHEAYSYVWNNPISFNDPTGMQGEEVSDWITNGKGYRWDPKVTGPENTPNGWKYVGPTGSYRIPGATVQLLEEGKTFTDIDEVVTRGNSSFNAAAITVGVGSSESGVGLFILLAVVSKLIIDDIFNTPLPIQHGIQIDPMMYSPQTMNTESDEDKDVNGQDVPKEKKVPVSGKTGKEAAKDVPSWAKEQGEAPYVDEDGKTFAERLLNGQYGKGEWNKGKASKGPGSEFNKIKKWGDRGFEVKKK